MNKALTRAVKLRDSLLADLQSKTCNLTWNGDDSFARDVEQRILTAKPFFVEDKAIKFLLESAIALSEEDFYQAIASIRLPFNDIWLEFGASTIDGKHHGRIGALLNQTDEGLRVYVVQLFKVPKEKRLLVHYSGTEVTYHKDGTVIFSDTPSAFIRDLMTEGEAGKLTRDKLRFEAPFDPQTVRGREQDDLQYTTKCIALMVALASLHNRPDIIHIEEPSPLSKNAKKSAAQKDVKPPELALSKI